MASFHEKTEKNYSQLKREKRDNISDMISPKTFELLTKGTTEKCDITFKKYFVLREVKCSIRKRLKGCRRR